jgi:metallophosphoesterase (TIGR00282 family)
MALKILFIGDVVGKPGRRMVARAVPRLVALHGIDLVVANAENAAGGSGITQSCYEELLGAGVAAFTMGDHVYRKREILALFAKTDRIVRPANYPPDAPGPAYTIVPARNGTPVAVFTILGRLFMKPTDCPLRAADRVLGEIGQRARVVVVDVHAEATSDKQLVGRYLDGRVSAVLGTHTHVPTADETILPGGTAYMTDVGMTGPYESIIGRQIEAVLHTALHFEPRSFEVATGNPCLAGAIVEVDPTSGRALRLQRVFVREQDLASLS